MVFDLSVFIPGGNYCDLEAEDQLSTPMKQIPFTLGPHDIRVLPYSATLKYQIWKKHTKRGAPCPPPSTGGDGPDGIKGTADDNH